MLPEIGLPNEQGRLEILKIHAKSIAKGEDIDYEAVVKLSDGFNGADLRNICTEAGRACSSASPLFTRLTMAGGRHVCAASRARLYAVRGLHEGGPQGMARRQMCCGRSGFMAVDDVQVAESKKLEGKMEYKKV